MALIRILASLTSCDSERTVNRLGYVASQIRRAMDRPAEAFLPHLPPGQVLFKTWMLQEAMLGFTT